MPGSAAPARGPSQRSQQVRRSSPRPSSASGSSDSVRFLLVLLAVFGGLFACFGSGVSFGLWSLFSFRGFFRGSFFGRSFVGRGFFGGFRLRGLFLLGLRLLLG